MRVRRNAVLTVVVALTALLYGASANATTYTDVIGPNFSFTGIQETSSSGDPEPLFDQPVLGAGNQLDFNPTTFSAFASGSGGFDTTGSQMQLQITGNTIADIIDTVLITEVGTVDLTGVGTASTGTFAGMAGFIARDDLTLLRREGRALLFRVRAP